MTTPSITARQSPSRIDELDGLRGILALWVALIHIISWCGLAPLAFSLPVAPNGFGPGQLIPPG